MLAILAQKAKRPLARPVSLLPCGRRVPAIVQAALRPVPVGRHRFFEWVGSRRPTPCPSFVETKSTLAGRHANANNFESHCVRSKARVL